MSRRLAWSAWLLVAILTGGALRAQTAPAPAGAAPAPAPVGLDPPAGALVPTGPAPDLVVLYSGDVIGYVDPCG